MAVSSDLQQYTIADFLEWHEKKQLKLNPDFQRGSVWPPPAKTYLIDTILRKLPVPKIYLRTRVDLETKRSFREVVDGQQRLRAVIDFSDNKYALTARAQEYAGKRYSDLTPDEQERFLGYSIAVDQLINASDKDVLEVFSRLNSYTVPVNPPELRHAKYQGEFKWSIHEKSQKWSTLWDDYKVVGARDALRLLSDSLTAEMFGILLHGITDGGQPKINALYERHDGAYTRGAVEDQLDEILDFITSNLSHVLQETVLSNSPHFLMIFAAVAHAIHGIPLGELEELPTRKPIASKDRYEPNLYALAEIISGDDFGKQAASFKRTSVSSTQRIASRRTRFPVYFTALTEAELPWQ